MDYLTDEANEEDDDDVMHPVWTVGKEESKNRVCL